MGDVGSPASPEPPPEGEAPEVEPAGDVSEGEPSVTVPREDYPTDYIPPSPEQTARLQEAYEDSVDPAMGRSDPSHWVGEVNPTPNEPAGMLNCGECTRSVANTFDGNPTVAAGYDAGSPGEPTQRMEDWAGQPQEAMPGGLPEVGQRLETLPDGSHAVRRRRLGRQGRRRPLVQRLQGRERRTVRGWAGRCC